jgi:hypothetical protein
VIVTVRSRFEAIRRDQWAVESLYLQPLATPGDTHFWTQNPAKFTLREGSTPSSATKTKYLIFNCLRDRRFGTFTATFWRINKINDLHSSDSGND